MELRDILWQVYGHYLTPDQALAIIHRHSGGCAAQAAPPPVEMVEQDLYEYEEDEYDEEEEEDDE